MPNGNQDRLMEKRSDTPQTEAQYSLARILSIWAIVSLPMALLAWIVTPALIPHINLHPGIIFWLMMVLGMTWQFVVSLSIVYKELGTLNWSAIRHRTWLNLPRDARTNAPRAKLFWWLLPCGLLSALYGISGIGHFLNAPVTFLFPFLSEPSYTDIRGLASPEFVGQWWLVGLAVITCALNYFLGEEFLFRGVLLPKMQGVFGKWDWVANSALFGLYHLHKAWMIPSIIVGSLFMVWPSRYFRSNWFAIIIHGVEGVFVLGLVLGSVLGLIHR